MSQDVVPYRKGQFDKTIKQGEEDLEYFKDWPEMQQVSIKVTKALREADELISSPI